MTGKRIRDTAQALKSRASTSAPAPDTPAAPAQDPHRPVEAETVRTGRIAFSTRSAAPDGVFSGMVYVAYVPGGGQIAPDALRRMVLDVVAGGAHQERLTVRIRDALRETLRPRGVAIVVVARHEGHGGGMVSTTCATSGVFDEQEPRREVLRLLRPVACRPRPTG